MHVTTTNQITTRSTTRRPVRRLAAAPLAALVALVPLAACSSDDDAAAETTTTEAPASTSTTHADHAEPGEYEVTLSDYEFTGLPDEVAAGSKLTVVNTATTELHELVAIRLPGDEERSVEELVALPEDEVAAILGGGPPAAVLLAPPGGEQIAAVGDGTLSEPGRYAIICSIPTGVAPEVYLKAAAESNGAPPQVEGGAPHLAHGMFAELIVN